MRLQRPDSDGLNKLLHVSNTVVQEYSQPPLYAKQSDFTIVKSDKSPNQSRKRKAFIEKTASYWKNLQDLSTAFHVSIAWTLTAPSEEVVEWTKSVSADKFGKIKQIQISIEEIKAKVGNNVTSISLPKSVTVEKSLFGV